jgi:hypothetical protein
MKQRHTEFQCLRYGILVAHTEKALGGIFVGKGDSGYIVQMAPGSPRSSISKDFFSSLRILM